jgi:hypothetical protein
MPAGGNRTRTLANTRQRRSSGSGAFLRRAAKSVSVPWHWWSAARAYWRAGAVAAVLALAVVVTIIVTGRAASPPWMAASTCSSPAAC